MVRLAVVTTAVNEAYISCWFSDGCLEALYLDDAIPSPSDLRTIFSQCQCEHLSLDVVMRDLNTLLSFVQSFESLSNIKHCIPRETCITPPEVVTVLPTNTRNALTYDLHHISAGRQIDDSRPQIGVCIADERTKERTDVTITGYSDLAELADGTLVENLTFECDFPIVKALIPPKSFKSVSDVVQNAQSEFSEDIHFLDSALPSAEQSPYLHVDRVHRIFQGMSKIRKLRIRAQDVGAGAGKSLAESFANLGITYAAHESEATKNAYKNEYTVEHDGKTEWIDQHIKLGTSFDERDCLRIYFFICAKTNKFIVAHVGKHKPNVSN